MELPVAEDLLRNTENFNIAFGNVVHMNYANNSEEIDEYNITIQRDNISKHIKYICMLLEERYIITEGIAFTDSIHNKVNNKLED